MDNDGGLGFRWGYHDQAPPRRNLGLQLNSTEHDMTKPFLTNGVFLHRNCGVSEPSVPMEFMREGWIQHNRDKIFHAIPLNHHPGYCPLPPEPHVQHTHQMMQPPDPPKDEIGPPPGPTEEPKKRSRGRSNKPPKPKKPKKAAAPKEETADYLVSRPKPGKKSMGLVINGMDFDISGIPPPVCSCTGASQQCYRWGVGGWQSACCTTSMSVYPLPMSTKRRGARIAGRKMSQGAFTKVLERLAGEGYNLANPIDLKAFWAKHGTNKFVTIR